MYINKGKRDILIFPKFDNLNIIQKIRKKYDKLANLVLPHITVVFPFFDNISNEELTKKLSNLLKDFSPFNVTFNGISLSNDNYIFLNCTYGSKTITKLHDEIYNKILPSHLKSSTQYVPHITLGKALNLTEFENFNYTFSTLVDEISIELIGENEESIIIQNIKL